MRHVEEILLKLDARRRELKMPRRFLAELSGLTWRTIQRVLSGETNTSLRTVLSIAEALGTEITLVDTRSISQVRRQQARSKAHRLAEIRQGSASLEGVGVSGSTMERTEREIEERLLSGPPLRLWG